MKGPTSRFTTLLPLLLAVSAQAVTEPADVMFKNGRIYTANERQPKVEAVAVKAGRIVFVGSNRHATKSAGPNTRVIDLHGRTMVAGLTDSHCHLSGIGFREMTLNLEGTASLEEFLARVKARIAEAKPGDWITGRGWIETFWNPPAFPTRLELDQIASENPIILTRADGHASVVNSAALKMAGIDKTTPNPFGGEISKDKQSGEPNGMLLDAAQELIRRHIPQRTAEDADRAILLGVNRCLELGWTQIQDAGGSFEDVARYQRLYGEGKIKLRIYQAVYGPGPSADRLLAEGPIIGAFDNRFTLRAIKVVADGALGSRGAALLEPYSDAQETSGYLTVKEDALRPMLLEALRKGLQVETHAIGDRANRFILDEYERALATVSPRQRKLPMPRWRIEHAQIVDAADILRFAKLGAIPSMQPSHAIGDLHFARSRLGLKRLAGAYAWQSFFKSGSVIAGGSDAPVERGEPMIEFYAAVARKDMKGFTGEGWHPEQAVSRLQALKMFTLWPAYAAFEETIKGSIEPGKLADFTVLSADIMKIPVGEILKTHCVMTVIGGEIAYQEP
jgi:predicted amidohydrolase YtcJ